MARKESLTDVEIQRRLEDRRWQRKLVERQKRKERRSSGQAGKRKRPRGRASTIGRQEPELVEVKLPKALDLSTAHQGICDAVGDVIRRARGGQRVCLMFNEVQSVKLSALTYLLAQIHKLRLESGDDRVTGTYPIIPKIERLFAHSGFFNLLNVKVRAAGQRRSRNTRYVRFRSEEELQPGIIGELREELLGHEFVMPPAIKSMVFRALTEAMINVRHHAYETKHLRVASMKNRWWLLAALSLKKNVFTLVFYDAGVGIPKTLPRTNTWEHIRGVLSLLPTIDPDDGQMIDAAMKLGRTRTQLSHRGKGLLDLVKLIDRVGAGEMTIYSRRGAYRYTTSGGLATNLPGFLEGTLIEWTLPIDKAIEVLPSEIHGPDTEDDD